VEVARTPSPLRRIFADNIRARRRILEISQEELADRCGLHRTYVGAVERAERNVSIDNIARISAALDATASEMLNQSES
jgi:transcriptional regulator with XRE-family HTH domain